MALNNGHGTSIIIFFLILTFSRVEAYNTSHPVTENENQNGSSDCPEKYIKAQMEETTAKCNEFVQKEIERRLQDPRLIEKDMKCLASCSDGYKAGIGYLTKGITDVSAGLYVPASQDVVAFLLAIAPCMVCSAEITVNDPEFWEFQKWAKESGEDLNKKLKSCQPQ